MIRLGQFPDRYKSLPLSRCGALFLSSPHSGTSAADWNGPLLTIAELAFGVRHRDIVNKLKPFNDERVASKELFARFASGSPFYCLCEGSRTAVLGTYQQVMLLG